MLKAYNMNVLAQLLSSQVRAEVFRLLYSGENPSLHLREIQRKSSFAIGTIQREIFKLKELDLVLARKDGNRLYYTANTAHPLYVDICNLVEKTCGLTEQLRDLFSKIKEVECVFIFGSYANETEKAHSDIDLVIIGDTSLRSISSKLKAITERVEREVNPHVYSRKAWRDKLNKRDHFVKSIFSEKKIFLVGDENDIS